MPAKKKAKGTATQPARKPKRAASKPGRAIRLSAVAKPKDETLPQPTSGVIRRPAALLPPGYAELLEDIKDRVRHAQVRAAVGASRELIRLYWDIGREIVLRQERDGWGRAVVQRLAADLQREFPGMAGFSPQNIWYMRAFYLAWTEDVAKLQQPVGELDGRNLPQLVGEIPWGHNLQLLAKLKDPLQRLWYAQKAVQHGWSRATLVHQIELDLYGREGRAITNFPETLPAPKSDLAQQTLKDPYVFDFLTLAEDARERDLERGLLELSLFGSVLRDDFGPESDIDVLVSFTDDAPWSLWDLTAMSDELSGLVGRRVDLVEKEGLRNPFRRHTILATRQVIYDSGEAT